MALKREHPTAAQRHYARSTSPVRRSEHPESGAHVATRRDLIRTLGAVLLSPIFAAGCHLRDLVSPGPHEPTAGNMSPFGARRRVRLAASGKSILLFVPGFTGAVGGVTRSKEKYYESQIAHFTSTNTYEVVNMNDVGGFDSDRAAIRCNALAIANYLRGVADGRPVTIVTHSKGGQDVLHALVKLNNESRLPYNGGNEGPGRAINRDLWEKIAGWVAFTTNWFESEFPVFGDKGANGCHHDNDRPDTCSVGCNVPRDQCETENTSSRYSGYPRRSAFPRSIYMADHERAIRNLLACVPTASLWGRYIPVGTNKGQLDALNRGIRNNSTNRGANDGVVPVRAGKLHGASFIEPLRDDPNLVHGPRPIGYAPKECGVDHLAPAFDVPDRDKRFWTQDWRNSETERLIGIVESASGRCPVPPPTPATEVAISIKPEGDPNSINCHNVNGVITVAIITTDDFDATTVDHATVTFEGATPTHIDPRTGIPRRHEEDADGDGRTDLVFHFRMGETALDCDSTEGRLDGQTFGGEAVFGTDAVRMVDGGGNRRGDGGGNRRGNGGGNGRGNR